MDLARGFKNSYWPAVIGSYTLEWPANPSEIVLASNHGSGPLLSLQARGRIYVQNDKSQPGYNPNEEHALMQGGQAFALRDDLNITNSVGYSSHPFVLLEYTEADSRPALRVFKVLREKPEEGLTFEYILAAGTVLQPPMPLPLLEKPLAPKLVGAPPLSLNREMGAWIVASNSTNSAECQLTTQERHFFRQYQGALALQDVSQSPMPLRWFYPLEVDQAAYALIGPVSLHKPYTIWNEQVLADPTMVEYYINDASGLNVNDSVVLVASSARKMLGGHGKWVRPTPRKSHQRRWHLRGHLTRTGPRRRPGSYCRSGMAT